MGEKGIIEKLGKLCLGYEDEDRKIVVRLNGPVLYGFKCSCVILYEFVCLTQLCTKCACFVSICLVRFEKLLLFV